MTIEVAKLIPHAGKMCLLERVVDWNDTMIVVATSSHCDKENPLRSDDRLRAIHLCEYGAQAMAVHGGLLASVEGTRAQPGLLVSLRNIELFCDTIDQMSNELVVTARRVQQTHSAWQYDFEICHDLEQLCAGRAVVSLLSAP